jgi:hypothetical protein
MEKVLTELCAYLNNYFWRTKRNVKMTISGGTFTVDFLKEGQYFRILNSDLNDGVYKYPVTDLKDEEFEGQIWSMAVPQTVIDLASEIGNWQAKYGSVDSENMSPFNSESFNNYSYNKDSAGSSANGLNSNSWQAIFATRLIPYRRLRGLP